MESTYSVSRETGQLSAAQLAWQAIQEAGPSESELHAYAVFEAARIRAAATRIAGEAELRAQASTAITMIDDDGRIERERYEESKAIAELGAYGPDDFNAVTDGVGIKAAMFYPGGPTEAQVAARLGARSAREAVARQRREREMFPGHGRGPSRIPE